MAKGENIFRRKDGRWEARYVKGRRLDGKIQYGFCYGKSYKEAKEKVTAIKAALILGFPAENCSQRRRLGQYCDDWLADCSGRVKESTYVKYAGIIRKHIKPHLGGCHPQAVTERTVRDFLAVLQQSLSPKTTKDVLTVLRSVLNFAGKQPGGSIPALEIPCPREQRKEVRVLSVEEQKVLTARLLRDDDIRELGILLALLTGMRVGELCALRWENVDFQERTIRIRATMQRLSCEGGTKIVITAPKSEKSLRVIPMTELAAQVLLRMKPGDGFVLTGSEQYAEPRIMQYRLARITEECGLEGVHFHTLRHTFATRCVEVGFEIKSLSEILGHSGTGITLDRYVHASLALKRENMDKLEAAGM